MDQTEPLDRISSILMELESAGWEHQSMLRAARQRIITALKKKDDARYSVVVSDIIEVLAKSKDKSTTSDIAVFSLKVSSDFDAVVTTTHRYLPIADSIPGHVSDTGVFHRGFEKYHNLHPDPATGTFLHMKEHIYASTIIRREGLSNRTYYSDANLFPPLVERYYDHVNELIDFVKDREIDLKEGFDHEAFALYLSTLTPSLRRGWL